VIIQIRDCQGWNDSNPFALEQVKNRIRRDLEPLYQGQFEIQVVPNIVEIAYGVIDFICRVVYLDDCRIHVSYRKVQVIEIIRDIREINISGKLYFESPCCIESIVKIRRDLCGAYCLCFINPKL
jgi:hypothetical protein